MALEVQRNEGLKIAIETWRNGPMLQKPEVSICIPTYSTDQPQVKRCIDAIWKHTSGMQLEIVIADCRRQLLGYTAPQNAAMACGRGRYLVAMNDDVEVTPGWLDTLLYGLRESAAWCVTPDATHTDGPQVFAPYCMAWPADYWRLLGGLDEQFVFWCSDIDLARRLHDLGRPPLRLLLHEPIKHELNVTANAHPELRAICLQDLQRFRAKWGVEAEDEKHRLAAGLLA